MNHMKLSRMLNRSAKRIALVGNIAVGKTALARYLGQELNLPVIHVDAIQFDQNLQIEDLEKTRNTVRGIEKEPSWIIDGHGPLDMLENRFRLADQIIFLDRPLWKNYFWLTYRQIKNFFKPRVEFFGKKTELNWSHTKKLYKTAWKIHKKMRPELHRMLGREEFKNKTLIIGNFSAARI